MRSIFPGSSTSSSSSNNTGSNGIKSLHQALRMADHNHMLKQQNISSVSPLSARNDEKKTTSNLPMALTARSNTNNNNNNPNAMLLDFICQTTGKQNKKSKQSTSSSPSTALMIVSPPQQQPSQKRQALIPMLTKSSKQRQEDEIMNYLPPQEFPMLSHNNNGVVMTDDNDAVIQQVASIAFDNTQQDDLNSSTTPNYNNNNNNNNLTLSKDTSRQLSRKASRAENYFKNFEKNTNDTDPGNISRTGSSMTMTMTGKPLQRTNSNASSIGSSASQFANKNSDGAASDDSGGRKSSQHNMLLTRSNSTTQPRRVAPLTEQEQRKQEEDEKTQLELHQNDSVREFFRKQREKNPDGTSSPGSLQKMNSVSMAADHRIKLNEIASRTLRQLALLDHAKGFDADTMRVRQLESVQYDEVHFGEMCEVFGVDEGIVLSTAHQSQSSASAPTHILWEHMMKKRAPAASAFLVNHSATATAAAAATTSTTATATTAASTLQSRNKIDTKSRNVDEKLFSGLGKYKKSTTSNDNKVNSLPKHNNNNNDATAASATQKYAYDAHLKLFSFVHPCYGTKMPVFSLRPSLSKAGPPSKLIKNQFADPASSDNNNGNMFFVPLLAHNTQELQDAISHARFGTISSAAANNKNSVDPATAPSPKPPSSSSALNNNSNQQRPVLRRSPVPKHHHQDTSLSSEQRERRLVANQLASVFSKDVLDEHTSRLSTMNKRRFPTVTSNNCNNNNNNANNNNNGATGNNNSNIDNNHNYYDNIKKRRKEKKTSRSPSPSSFSRDGDGENGTANKKSNVDALVEQILREDEEGTSSNNRNDNHNNSMSMNGSLQLSTSGSFGNNHNNNEIPNPKQRAKFFADRLLRTRDKSLFSRSVLQAENDFLYRGGMSVPQDVLERAKRQQFRDEKTAGVEKGAVLREMLRHTSNSHRNNNGRGTSMYSSSRSGGGDNDDDDAADALAEERRLQIEMRKAQDELQWKQSYLRGAAVAEQSEFVARATAVNLGLTSIGIPRQYGIKDETMMMEKKNNQKDDNDEEGDDESSSRYYRRNESEIEQDAVITHRMHQQWDISLKEKFMKMK